jgi:hypothetical protein
MPPSIIKAKAWGSGAVTITASASNEVPSSIATDTSPLSASRRTANAMVEQRISRPTARSLASEFIPPVAT